MFLDTLDKASSGTVVWALTEQQMIMLDRCLVKFVLLSLLMIWGSLYVSSNGVRADESDLLELVKKHDDQWKEIDSIQLSYTRNYKSSIIVKFFPDCYWESDKGRVRSIIALHDSFSTNKDGKPVIVDVCEDFFYDGSDSYRLTIPRNKYPLTEVQLCDYAFSRNEGYSASIVSGSVFDVRLGFPLPRYFSVHTEKRGLTLTELVNKYPSKIISCSTSPSGDNLVEISIECNIDNHEHFKPWKLNISINLSKGYSIESYHRSTLTKREPLIELITEGVAKNYIEIEGKYWIPSEWETIQHNGNPPLGIRTNIVIDNCRINNTLESRLNDFRFPVNFLVNDQSQVNQPPKLHIWGQENKPIRSFDTTLKFMEYYSSECMSGEIPPRSDYFALRIVLVILGLILIVVALYKLYYAKNQ